MNVDQKRVCFLARERPIEGGQQVLLDFLLFAIYSIVENHFSRLACTMVNAHCKLPNCRLITWPAFVQDLFWIFISSVFRTEMADYRVRGRVANSETTSKRFISVAHFNEPIGLYTAQCCASLFYQCDQLGWKAVLVVSLAERSSRSAVDSF